MGPADFLRIMFVGDPDRQKNKQNKTFAASN